MPITGTNERAVEKQEGGEKVHHCTLHSGDGEGGEAASLSICFFPALCSYTRCSRLFPTPFAEKTFLLPFSPIPAWSLGDDDDDSFFPAFGQGSHVRSFYLLLLFFSSLRRTNHVMDRGDSIELACAAVTSYTTDTSGA